MSEDDQPEKEKYKGDAVVRKIQVLLEERLDSLNQDEP